MGVLGAPPARAKPRAWGRLLASTGLVVALAILALSAAVLKAERGAPDATITSLPEALWWAMTTTTTVGYGDLAPVTADGRVYGSILMVIGIGTMGTVTAALASRLFLAPERAEPAAAELGAAARAGEGSAGAGALDRLARLGELRERGVVTDEEFARKKAELLERV
ncbi:ion channel [Streptomyces boncukensis]|uniref:ion channel n=1 Tax=Streptomyces boncukensis TaxID=2711219 RepID=UPI0019D1C212